MAEGSSRKRSDFTNAQVKFLQIFQSSEASSCDGSDSVAAQIQLFTLRQIAEDFIRKRCDVIAIQIYLQSLSRYVMWHLDQLPPGSVENSPGGVVHISAAGRGTWTVATWAFPPRAVADAICIEHQTHQQCSWNDKATINHPQARQYTKSRGWLTFSNDDQPSVWAAMCQPGQQWGCKVFVAQNVMWLAPGSDHTKMKTFPDAVKSEETWNSILSGG